MMLRFLARRTVQLVVALFLLILITFVLLHLAPGGPARALLGPDQFSPEEIARVETSLGLRESLPSQIGKWMKAALSGDFGTSYFYRLPALEVVFSRLPSSLILGGIATIIAVIIGIPAGVAATARPGGWFDRLSRSTAVALISTPSFWLGILLIFLFSVQFGILPSSGTGRNSGDWLPSFRNLVLPAITMALPAAATFMLYTRTAMQEAMETDAVRTARGMGLPERKIMFGHALPQAIAPVLMQIGLFLPHLVEGSIVVETVFSWPGIGQLTSASVARRDYPILLALTVVLGMGTVVASTLTDLVHAKLDPRIELR